ncbi:uncharacterized protein LOC124691372 [Lolium rigidum]|uniref:uncharacterized protein LOC124691372 n=1 Tax=Lolium rigidum TaxID=89674 RepID=UPI001F5DCD62|nr:uncharacterized protein LOC124691372 [Lolium rigidum]
MVSRRVGNQWKRPIGCSVRGQQCVRSSELAGIVAMTAVSVAIRRRRQPLCHVGEKHAAADPARMETAAKPATARAIVQAAMYGSGRGRERLDSKIPVKIQSEIFSTVSVSRGMRHRMYMA